jgi:hypothetical protein
MARSDNFFCYRNILTIDPGYSHENGTGYAIFDGDNYHLKACGLIRPFAPGLENSASTIEIADKVRKIWEQEVGFSFDPKVLCTLSARFKVSSEDLKQVCKERGQATQFLGGVDLV